MTVIERSLEPLSYMAVAGALFIGKIVLTEV